jgi:hypothetical protein
MLATSAISIPDHPAAIRPILEIHRASICGENDLEDIVQGSAASSAPIRVSQREE